MKKRMEVTLEVKMIDGDVNGNEFKHEIGRFVTEIQVDDGAVMGHYNMLEHVIRASVDAIDKEKLTDLRGEKGDN